MNEFEFQVQLVQILNKYALTGPKRYKVLREELSKLYHEACTIEPAPVEVTRPQQNS